MNGTTKAVSFHHAPAFADGMFSVNAGVDVAHADFLCTILLSHVRERFNDVVQQQELLEDEAAVLNIIQDMAMALRESVRLGERAPATQAQVDTETSS